MAGRTSPPTTNYVRLASPGSDSFYVVEHGDDGVRAYGRREGTSNIGDPPRAVAYDVRAGGDPRACVASLALGTGRVR